MINSSEWKEFKIGDLFLVKNNPQLNKSSFNFSKNGEYPYFTRTVFNNGILGYVDYLDEEHKIKGNSIAVGMIAMKFFYMKQDFYAGQFTKTIYPKFDNFNDKIAKYFISIFNKNTPLYLKNFVVKDFEKDFTNTTIKLPITENGKIDFDFMENFIDKIEQKQRGILEFYKHKKQNGGYELNSKTWQEFKIGDLFTSKTGDTDLQQKDINGKGEYFLNSGYANCGVNGKTDRPARIFLKNTITIDFLGYVFYRNFDYKMATHNHIFSLSGEVIKNEKIGLFLVTSLSYLKNLFSFSNMGTWTKFKDLNIKLPITANGAIDFDFMESFIKTIQKECIKGVDSYLAKNIATTKELIK